jgi:predicted ATPase/DNA-binding SARP family transcriptional activator
LPELNLVFLGPLQITHRKWGEVVFPNRKALALFAYLVIESDHPQSRESLLGLLWPELPTPDAQNNLRVTWSQLRKRLGEAQDEAHSYLLATRLTLQFNPNSDHRLDVTLFQDLLEACRIHEHPSRPECAECADRLTQALDLVRGKFLAGFSLADCPAFEEWLFVQRERLHLQITNALEGLADFHERAGNLVDAEKYTLRLLELDPLREPAHRQLMRLLAGAGRRSAALNQYETCRRLLADELGVSPAPETVILAEQIRALAPTQTDTPRHNLPPPLSRFIGRKGESAGLRELLTKEPGGVVTLTGPGGVGKTRLALQAAYEILNRFSNGVWLVELAGVSEASAVPAAVASALKVVPDARRSLTRRLGDYLRDKSLLLVLDNCEHLVDACAQLVRALRLAAPGLVVLVTSRVPLHLEEERVVRLQPFPSPEFGPSETLTAALALQFDSIQLFAHRAAQSLLSFALNNSNAAPVAEICQHLDGIPLAIELAAARAGSMPVEAIARRLDQRFRWLNSRAGGVLPRQRTLHALIDWSYDLLSEQERSLFCRLAVFAGGWTLEAAEAVSADAASAADADACADLLSRLVDQSLVVFGDDPEGKRYHMHETIRQFAAEKLSETGDQARTSALQEHHAYFTKLLASQAPDLRGIHPQNAIKRIYQDLDNIRRAWHWGVTNAHLDHLGASVKGLSLFYELSGLLEEGERMLAQALSVTERESGLSSKEKLSLQIDLSLEQARLLVHQAKHEAALEQAQKALSLAKDLNDVSRMGCAQLLLGQAHFRGGAPRKSRDCLETGLVHARQARDLALEGEMLRYLGSTLQVLDERQQGDACLQQALQIMRRLGNRSQEQAILLYLGVSSIEALDYVAGRMYLEEALQLIQSTGNRPLESRIQNAIGFVNAALGELETALLYHERSRQISHEMGDPYQESHADHNLCTVNRKLGRLELAEQWGQQALLLAQRNELADPTAYAWLHLGYVFRERGKLSQAADAFTHSRDGWLVQEHNALATEAIAGLAGTRWRQADRAQSLSLVEQLLDFLARQPLEGVDEPVQIYLTYYHVLKDCGDPRAGAVLRQAHDRLMTTADKIFDPAIRTAFLKNVPAHRELMQLWTEFQG